MGKGYTIQGDMPDASYSFTLHGCTVTINNREIAGWLRDTPNTEECLIELPEVMALLLDGLAHYRTELARAEDKVKSASANRYLVGKEMKTGDDDKRPSDTYVGNLLAASEPLKKLRSEVMDLRDMQQRLQDSLKLMETLWEGARSLNTNSRDLAR